MDNFDVICACTVWPFFTYAENARVGFTVIKIQDFTVKSEQFAVGCTTIQTVCYARALGALQWSRGWTPQYEMRAVRSNWLLVELRAHRSGSVRLERLHVTQRVAGFRARTFLARFAFLLDHHPSPFCPRILEPHLEQRKTPCSLVGGYQNSEGPQCFHLHNKCSLLLSNYNNLGFEACVRSLIFVLNSLRQTQTEGISQTGSPFVKSSVYTKPTVKFIHISTNLYQKHHNGKQHW